MGMRILMHRTMLVTGSPPQHNEWRGQLLVNISPGMGGVVSGRGRGRYQKQSLRRDPRNLLGGCEPDFGGGGS